MRQKLTFITLILTCLFIIAGCSGEDENKENEEQTVTPVEVEDVQKGNFEIEKSVYGQTTPVKQTPVMLEQPGEMTTLKVENGDEVNKDNHLATVKTPMGNQTINASTDGQIAQLDAKEGAFQSNEDPLMVIVDLDKVTATFSVTSSVRDLFEKDDKVTIHIEDEKYEGKVLAIDSMPNDTGQYPINIEIDNEDKDILPGMAAKLTMKEQRLKDTLIVPTEAIVTEADEDFVFLLDGDHAKKVKVDIQETQSKETAIKADLDKGDQVIVSGQHTLADDSEVDVKEGKED